jgi:hypothetical protein
MGLKKPTLMNGHGLEDLAITSLAFTLSFLILLATD